MMLPITSTIAAALAIVMFPLTVQVSMRRAAIGVKAGDVAKAVFGDADDPGLRAAIRAFGNFTEYAPMCLLLLALMELQGASSSLLWGIGGAFVLGRLIHGLSMTYIPRSPAPRGLAMIATYASLLVPAWWFLNHHYF